MALVAVASPVEAGYDLFVPEVTSNGTGRVLRIDAAGNRTVFAEAGLDRPTGQDLGAVITGLNVPYGLAIDGSGHYFVSELLTNRIREFSSTGRDLGVFASSGLSNPSGLAFDGDGNLYVVNNNNGAARYVRKFSGAGAGRRTLLILNIFHRASGP